MRKMFVVALLAVASPACKSHSKDAADNTAQNARDRKAVPTADNAGATASDRDVTQQIRKAVIDDSSLSTNAHNCKIVVENGAVTLVGPVASETERTKVQQIAAAVVGDKNVINQLAVTN